MKQPRRTVKIVKEIELSEVHSPPIRQARKDYIDKTPADVTQMEIVKGARS